jgi:predicted esterase
MIRRKIKIESYCDIITKQKVDYVVSIPKIIKANISVIVNLHSCHKEPMDIEKCIEMGWLEMERWSKVKGIDEFIIIHPTGFGNTMFAGVGEIDVLCSLADIGSKYQINLDKIFILGFSMGGAGALNIGVKYPYLFCGVCSISGYSNFALWSGPNRSNITKVQEIETMKREASFNVINFKYTNLFVSHGEWDLGVGGGVDFAHYKFMINELEKNGIKYTGVVYPKLSHIEFPIEKRQEVINWIGKQEKKSIPIEFEFSVSDLRHSNFYDIEALSLIDYSKKGIIKGKINNNRLLLDTINIASLRVDETKFEKIEYDRKITNSIPNKSTKHKGNSGPISDIIFTKILFSYEDKCCDEFSSLFQKEIATADFRFFKSLNAGISCGAFRNGCVFYEHALIAISEIPEQTNNHSIVLYGNTQTNRLIREIIPTSPFDIADNEIRTSAGNIIKGNLGLRFIFPNPNGGYYIVNTGTTEKIIAKGFGIWYGSLPDYIIYDELDIKYWGYFDSEWQFNEKQFYEVANCTC